MIPLSKSPKEEGELIMNNIVEVVFLSSKKKKRKTRIEFLS
jgi:hypothetical protein